MLYPSTRLQDTAIFAMQKMTKSRTSFFASFFVLQSLMFISFLYDVACKYALALCMASHPPCSGLQRSLHLAKLHLLS
ncbi:hypothetical protein KCU83_g1846, partial [Aureobasidium melanogenum]